MRITVLGSGSWGTALAILLGAKGFEVTLWGRRSGHISLIQQTRENQQYLPGFTLPQTVSCTANIQEAMQQCQAVVLAIPSNAVRDVAEEISGMLSEQMLLIHAGKGLESETGLRGSQIIGQKLGEQISSRIAALSGPNLAIELVRGVPSATVVASRDHEVACRVQEMFHCNTLRVYRSTDIIGVELGGALKNVMAIGAGISDGMGFGDNTKATLITRGLTEMTRLGTVLGADPATFMGLSGIGDLVATSSSRLSRNLRMGMMLGEGMNVQDSLSALGQVAEGVNTCKAAYSLSRKHSVEMPITEQIYGILFENKSPKQGVLNLMNRSYKEEKY